MILDFRHDQRLAVSPCQEPTQLFCVALLPHKTKRDKIHSQFCAEDNVGKILFRKRRQIYVNAGQIAARVLGLPSGDISFVRAFDAPGHVPVFVIDFVNLLHAAK